MFLDTPTRIPTHTHPLKACKTHTQNENSCTGADVSWTHAFSTVLDRMAANAIAITTNVTGTRRGSTAHSMEYAAH